MNGLIGLFILAFIAWYWRNSMRSLEQARRICLQLCRRDHLQLLDDTVVLTKTRLARKPNGVMGIRREYRFEFSADGYERRHGRIQLLGRTVEQLYFEQDDGTEIIIDDLE